MNLIQLRLAVREIFDEALRAVDPFTAVRASVRRNNSQLNVRDIPIDIGRRKIHAIAIGKAAARMAAAVEDFLGEKLTSGVITSSAAALAQIKLSPCWQRFHGGHPEPNDQSLAAAVASFDLLDRANNEGALLIFLISGGGSAMIEWPISEYISLKDLRTANQALVKCGASISEINSVRRAFSAVKGGRLGARAPNCEQITLIVSDVPEGEERNVASGPTLAPPNDAPNPEDVVARYNLRGELPATIVQAIDSTQPLNFSSESRRSHLVLLSNSDALQAAANAARQRGFIVELAPEISDQPIEDGCALLLKRLDAVRAKHRDRPRTRLEAGLVPPVGTSADSKQNGSVVCLISGGEFACPVRGSGIGGRNLETAMRLACTTNLSLSHAVALCAGTDGIDGNSPAAGAIIDSTTFERAKTIGLNVEDFLRRSDSYSFFIALGDVVATGPTGTNVRDVRILIAETD